jgi:hypothetical protein
MIKNELNEEYSSLESDIENYRSDVINDTTKAIEYCRDESYVSF